VTDLLTPYLTSLVATLSMVCAVSVAFFEFRRRSRDYLFKESRLPDAVRHGALKTEVEQLEASRRELREELAQSRVDVVQGTAERRWLLENHELYERAFRELPALKAQLTLERQQYEEARDQRLELQEECSEFAASLSKLRAEKSQFDGERVRWLSLIDSLQKEEIARTDRVNSLQADEIRLTGDISRLANRKGDAQGEVVRIEKSIEQAGQLLKTQHEELRSVEQSLQKVQGEYRSLTNQKEYLTQENNALTGSIQRSQEKLDNLDAEVRRKQETLQLNHIEVETCLSRIEGLKSSIALETTQHEKVAQELKAAENELRKVTLLQRETEVDREMLLNNLKVLENQKQRLEEEHRDIRLLIEAAEKRWALVAPSVGATGEQRLAELWEPVLLKKQFASKSRNSSEADSLSKMQEYLTQTGLRYNPRVLNQFHTSLKVAEMSPLVVLAGISGTGKSELPRRYAEGMGMYVLTMPVQPRWDSPQDMFGFYNYLENRYRATELSRALLQMDRFVDERKAEWNFPDRWKEHSLHERMLLVLLDEMNLARVEYYFSEFLSRLETRRGIDRTRSTERRKAEIVLEVGMTSTRDEDGNIAVNQKPTLPIFVDRNVLFVGTMNEDETTQTLSDKVVDRANVLRFGRPSALKSRSLEQSPKPPDSWLAFKDWLSWIKNEDTDLSPAVRTEVSSWIQSLNQAMQLVGRPFAHRTYASILSYVANYPDTDNYKLALADQIEMKLLPRIRGLDPQDNNVQQALGGILSVISSLGDDRLLAAVQESSMNDSHQFLWHGVDRADAP
jgi:hypothetical protein